jgi:hypothetical protein
MFFRCFGFYLTTMFSLDDHASAAFAAPVMASAAFVMTVGVSVVRVVSVVPDAPSRVGRKQVEA